ncbi:sensor histidine kinase [Chitinophaga sedimenti]|uniref:sensor histidine kinase n=1 Tax=Chitinophaga sedimenti TaxID=2033606 RepID=UPI00249EC26D|nr:HAMP domain-containing sensor histidine kinase [Chitinophaga sedimenti]
MFKQYLGWKFVLVAIAAAIIAATIWFAQNLSEKIEQEETKKVATWVEANKELLQASPDANINLAVEIVTTNTTIPLILTNAEGQILDHRNMDSLSVVRNPNYLKEQLSVFRKQHQPFAMQMDTSRKQYSYIYYGDSLILKQVRYYPYIQLMVVALFIGVVWFALSSTNKATQNQLWVGMAKETAHQLGTPLSSIEAWMEILKETHEENRPFVAELVKDLDRLKLITDRFSKIGSVPQLEERDIVQQISDMMEYIKKRAPQKIQFTLESSAPQIPAMISAPLFDWVVENLLKNALDAMEGKGSIAIHIESHAANIVIDVSDSGKGIPKAVQKKYSGRASVRKKEGGDWGCRWRKGS